MNRVNETISQSEKNQGHGGNKKVKRELSEGLLIINLFVKFNVHSSKVKQVIVLEVAHRWTDGRADGRTDGRTDGGRADGRDA